MDEESIKRDLEQATRDALAREEEWNRCSSNVKRWREVIDILCKGRWKCEKDAKRLKVHLDASGVSKKDARKNLANAKDRLAKASQQLDKVRTELSRLRDYWVKCEWERPAVGAPNREASATMIVEEVLNTVDFPDSLDDFEFRTFTLPPENPSSTSVAAANIIANWKNPSYPDFLVTWLDKPVTMREELEYNEHAEHKLSRTGNYMEVGTFTESSLEHVVLVSTSGSGKTRWIFEQAYTEFSCLFLGMDPGSGSEDLGCILHDLPQRIPDDKVDEYEKLLKRSVLIFVVIRAMVLRRLQRIEGFAPRHWLAFQRHHEDILKGRHIFAEMTEKLNNAKAFFKMYEARQMINETAIKFVAIDEAQAVDMFSPNTFARMADPYTTKCSALGPFTDALFDLNVQTVLSGTGPQIASWIPQLNSGLFKFTEVVHVKVYGVVGAFDSDDVEREIRARGYIGDIDPRHLRYFAGRPRFAMKLAAELLTEGDVPYLIRRIENQISVQLSRLKREPADPAHPNAPKRLFDEVVRAAEQWSLKGLGGLSGHGDIALEMGVCSISASSSKRMRKWKELADDLTIQSRKRVFHINEPIVVNCCLGMTRSALGYLTNEGDDGEIEEILQDTIAINAQGLLSAFVNMGGLPSKYRGPWKLLDDGGTFQRGVRVADGKEPKAIRSIWTQLLKENGFGVTIVFPGTSMGADIIIVARHKKNGKILLLFVQCKACFELSTPEAFRSLRFPYHHNRDKTPTVPKQYVKSLKELESIMQGPNVVTIFCVFKYPASSRQSEARGSEIYLAKWEYNGCPGGHLRPTECTETFIKGDVQCVKGDGGS